MKRGRWKLDDDHGSIIVQSDGTIFLEVDRDSDHACRDRLVKFAELIKSPEHVHTYRVTPLAIWNAASSTVSLSEIMDALVTNSRYDDPSNVLVNIRDWYSRYGKVRLQKTPLSYRGDELLESMPEYAYLVSEDISVIQEISMRKSLSILLDSRNSPGSISVRTVNRGRLKQLLIKIGFPVEDLIGYLPGDSLDLHLLGTTNSGKELAVRPYQSEAIQSFASGKDRGGSGIIVLPSGSGKTVVGMGIMSEIKENTLIITTGTVALRQWIRELTDKTSLGPEEIGEYSGDNKDIMPVTVTTYQILTYSPRRRTGDDEHEALEGAQEKERSISEKTYPHLDIFRAKNWGLIIYDEVHLLPAPVFRITTEIQAKKRLGLTATLVREDGREDDVFSLIGPKKYDAPWKDLEKQGWIATAHCYEVRVRFPDDSAKMQYAVAGARGKYRIAAENPLKTRIVKALLDRRSPDDSVLIIGDYLDQLESISSDFSAPIITGKMRNDQREKLYSDFRQGQIKLLVVSKVANYAIDLPDANVAIQVSGTFGSRQEEAQRIGRLLRPKDNGNSASFYTVVTKDTVDQEYALKRQLFLTERGYKYDIIEHDEIVMDVNTTSDFARRYPGEM